MTLRIDKDLKSKKNQGEKVYILVKEFEIKVKKMSACKRPIFLGHPNSGSFVQNA